MLNHTLNMLIFLQIHCLNEFDINDRQNQIQVCSIVANFYPYIYIVIVILLIFVILLHELYIFQILLILIFHIFFHYYDKIYTVLKTLRRYLVLKFYIKNQLVYITSCYVFSYLIYLFNLIVLFFCNYMEMLLGIYILLLIIE